MDSRYSKLIYKSIEDERYMVDIKWLDAIPFVRGPKYTTINYCEYFRVNIKNEPIDCIQLMEHKYDTLYYTDQTTYNKIKSWLKEANLIVSHGTVIHK